MGSCAKACDREFKYKKEELNRYTIILFKITKQTLDNKLIKFEIIKVIIRSKSGETVVEIDEGPSKVNYEKIPLLKSSI
jgi:acetyl-CoA C-acetyltransferase